MHLHGTLLRIKCFTFILACSFIAAAPVSAQQQPAVQEPPATGQTPTQASPKELPPDSIRPNYILGTNDQILIRTEAEEINDKPFRIDADGNLNLPLVGKIRAGGMSQQDLELELIRRLKEYFRD